MVAFYCQCRLLPALLGPVRPMQREELTAFPSTAQQEEEVGSSEWRAALPRRLALPVSLTCSETETLLPGLFVFYASEFDWQKEAISVRLGCRTLRPGTEGGSTGNGGSLGSELGGSRNPSSQRLPPVGAPLCIEDP